ncbi:MAG: TonB-dependent receptor [Rhodobacteraceae bacterium]|nr:TonB-dependent receptor [Paracoccaceae bacterium]
MKRTLLASAAFTALATAPALAEDIYDIGEIVVSAGLTDVDPARTGATVEVIEENEVQDADTSLIQTLAREPGVSFSANGGVGTNTTIRIRGLSNNYVGVRFDGIDVSDPSSTQTAFNFGGLTGAGIGRIEILKGSQSAIHGSEAIAGLIDITSKRPTELGFSGSVGGEIGSFNTLSTDFNAAYMNERAEISFSLSRFHTDGISARASDTEADGYEQTMLNFSTRYALTDTVTVGASALWRDYEVDIDRSTSDSSGINYGTQKGVRVFTEFQTGAVTHELAYSVYDTERLDPTGWTTYFYGDRKQLEYLGSVDLGANSGLAFGLDQTKETFELPSASGGTTTRSAFAELTLQPTSNLDLSVALRRDDHSIFGGATTGRLAAVWHLADDLRIRAVYGSGFRAPSLYELYGPYGNAALQPEKSRSAELGIEKDLSDKGSVRATLFRTKIDNLIEYDFVLSAYNQVPGTTVSKGIELAGDYAISDTLSLYANYTYTDAKNNGARLQRVPKHDLVLGANATFGNGFAGLAEIQHVADVLPSPYAPATHKVGDYTLLNLGLSYAINDSTQAYLRIENLLDEDYETAGGYNTPGRAAFFGVRASF